MIRVLVIVVLSSCLIVVDNFREYNCLMDVVTNGEVYFQ